MPVNEEIGPHGDSSIGQPSLAKNGVLQRLTLRFAPSQALGLSSRDLTFANRRMLIPHKQPQVQGLGDRTMVCGEPRTASEARVWLQRDRDQTSSEERSC